MDIKAAGLYSPVRHILLVYLLPRFRCLYTCVYVSLALSFKVFEASALTGIHSRAFQKCITMCIYRGVGVWTPARPISLTDFKDFRISITRTKDFKSLQRLQSLQSQTSSLLD